MVDDPEILDQSLSEKSRTSIPVNQFESSPLKQRPLTPLKTGGSLSGEINWENKTTQSNSKFGAPIASVESLSPTCK